VVGRLPSNIIKLTVVTVFNEKQFYVELCAGEGMMVEEIIIYADQELRKDLAVYTLTTTF